MWRSRALVILGYFITLLKAQASIYQPITPKISWTNVGIDPPTLTIFFQTDFITKNTLSNFWVKVSLPFLAYKMNAKWAMIPSGQCSTTSLTFYPTYEERYEADDIWTTFYVQLSGSTYYPQATYSLQFTPDVYLDFTGFSDSLKIAIISQNVDGHVIYAYNNAFNCLYGTPTPATDLILNDATDDPNIKSLNKVITSNLVLQIKGGIAERILIKTTGDYVFSDDAEIKCSTLADPKSNILEVPRTDYTCQFFQQIGGTNKNFLQFVWNQGKIPGGIYKLTFTLKTPIFGGSHSINVYAMDRVGSRIQSMGSLTNLFATVPSPWAPGFPKLVYSFGIPATDESMPQGVGLYSSTKGYNVVFNTLVFSIKAFFEVPTIPSGTSFSIEVQLGTTTAVCPLGSVYHNLNAAPGKKVIVSYASGKLRFDNVYMFNGKIYQVSLKVAYKDATTLTNDPVTGFGFVNLLYGNYIIFKSQAVMRNGFTKVFDNKPLITNRWIENNDPNFKRHRGWSAFRSGYNLGNTASDYDVLPNKNSLNIGDGQDLVVQTSIGPNFLYYSSVLDPQHDSSRTFFQLITHSSITSKTSSWADSFKLTNCRMYYPILAKWNDLVVTADMNAYVTAKYPGAVISIAPTGTPQYDFLGGCSYNLIQGSSLRYSRFRFRFQDDYFVDTTPVPAATYKIVGVEHAMYNAFNVATPGGIRGTTYVWKNIDITSYPSLISFGEADSVVLDLYFQVYFFASDPITDVDLTASPSISSLDNLVVLGTVDTSFPTASIYFAPQNVYTGYNAAAVAPTLHLTTNIGDLYPDIMHIHGTYGAMSNTVYAIKIFFDFIEPITISQDDTQVDCSFRGLTISKCEFERGIPDLLQNDFITVTGAAASCYAYNSRFANALIVYLNPPTVAGTFSLTFPFRYKVTTNIDNMNEIYTSLSSVTPSVMLLDNTYTPLTIIDYGQNFDYPIWAFHASMYTNIAASQTATPAVLDDATLNDNPANAAWMSMFANTRAGATPTLGIDLKSNCQSCPTTGASNYNFGTVTFCGKWDFSNSTSWSISNGLVANQFRCHKLKYFFQGSLYGFSDTMIYCVYCPGNDGVGPTFAQDATARTFHIDGFTMPYQNGLKWPTDTVGVVSSTVVVGWTLTQGLTTLFNPNTISILTTTIPLKQTKQSIIFQFTIVTTNPLPYGSAIHLLAVSGEQLLSVLGKTQNPPCIISQVGARTFKCTFTFVAGGIQLNLFDNVPSGRLDVSLYGISVGSVVAIPTCQFTVTSYLDQLRTAALVVDQTPASTFITINWDSPETSGSLILSALNSNIWQKLAIGDVYFTVTLADRSFLTTDFLSISLGAGAIMTDTSLVRCYIKDLNMSITLENIALCNIEDLSNIIVQFNGDTSTKSFIVYLVGITIPQYATPGITATYKYNGDYSAFTSNTLPWSSLVSFSQFNVAPFGYFQLDARGQRADLLITITPNTNIDVYRVMYVKLDTTFLGNISMYSFNVFQESDGMMLRSWNAGPGLLAITGWLFSIEGNLPYTFRIVGIEVPAATNVRSLEILIADETGLSLIDQWGIFNISAPPSMQGISLIIMDALRYDSNIIRINTGVEMDLIFTTTAPKYIYMRVFFDYLSQEIYKTFNPTCTLVLKGTKNNLITPCKSYGTKIEFFLGADMIAGNVYTLRINDIVNPDNGFCEPIPPRVIVSNAMKTKTVMLSSNVVQNFLQIPFTNQKGIKILNFVSIPKGYLEVWRGFYDKVDIGPIVTSSTERPYYYDKVTYTLSYDLDGLFASDVIYFLGINSFTSSIGQSRASFIIGANTNTVLTDYILYILRSEKFSQQYTSLPLLKVRILPNKATLITPKQIIVYKSANSLPIYIYPEKIPTLDTTFTISFVETFTDGLSIKDDLKEITLGVSTPLTFITISAESNTTVTSATLKISKKVATSPFVDKLVPILIQPIITTGVPNVLISTRDITQFDATLDFGSDQVLYMLFYISPTYSYKNFTTGTLNAWITAGITYVGDTKIGYAIINNAADLITYTYTDLLADTTYIVRTLYMTPINTTVIMEKTVNFTTLPRNATNGQLTFKFSDPLFMARRMWLLCQIAIRYAIPEEDLWTDDGLNCDSTTTPSFITKWHTQKEGAINTTIANQNDTSQVNSSILEPLKTINVLVFASRRRYQPPDTYELLFNETRTDTSIPDFQSFIGTTGKLTGLGNSIKLFIASTPSIVGTPKYTVTGSNVTVNGISLSTDGYLLLVYGRSELFTSSPSISDLKDVSTYSGFKYQNFAANASIQFVLSEGITPNINFTAYMVAFNNDPRINAKTSTAISFVFLVNPSTATSLSNIISLGTALLVFLTLAFA
jgi:hypothetical protein